MTESHRTFTILFEDAHFIAIHKPDGILAHRTKISEDTVFVLQLLRKQVGYRIYPVHRLDRATSGVLIFGKTKEAAAALSIPFRNQAVHKKYLAVVRGYVEEKGVIDYPLARSPKHDKQPAISHYKRLAQNELGFSVNRYPTSRYSLVLVEPQTGRHHQIRRHFAHYRHPVLNDRPHGDCKHNKYFREHLGVQRMLLHAWELGFRHPFTEEGLAIQAPLGKNFLAALKILGLNGDKVLS